MGGGCDYYSGDCRFKSYVDYLVVAVIPPECLNGMLRAQEAENEHPYMA